MNDAKIIVASHKPYAMPADRGLYVPVQVGAAKSADRIPGFQPDDEGVSISEKNASYCELTALYWAWKNLDSDVLGLAHYRRNFGTSPGRSLSGVLSREQVEAILSSSDVILPRKRHYYIETVRSHYLHIHEQQPLDACLATLADEWPKYSRTFNAILDSRSTHLYNMFITRKSVADDYCEWLFGVLSDIEAQVDTSGYTRYESRVFGFLGELLLDAWSTTEFKSIAELPVVSLESQHWPQKAGRFVTRKVRASLHQQNVNLKP